MKILDNVRVDTISMVKLGSRYYALKDEDAVRKSQLWEPETALTKEMLKAYYQVSFYETLSAAAADINADTVGTGVTTDAESENVAVYTDEKGNTVVTLLADVTETASVTVAKDVILRLNGKVLTFTESGTHLIFADTVANAVIDGRVPGSMITKTVSESSSLLEKTVEVFAEKCSVYGGAYHLYLHENTRTACTFGLKGSQFLAEGCSITAEQENGTGNQYCILSTGSVELKGCTMDCQSAGGMSRCVEVHPSGEYAKITDCVINAHSTGNIVFGFYPQCPSAILRNSEVNASTGTPGTNTATGKATAVEQLTDELLIENCRLSAVSTTALAYCIYAHKGKMTVRNTQVWAAASQNIAYGVRIKAAVEATMADTVCFADAISSFEDTFCSTGILNAGNLTLKNCSAYGTHSGMQLLPGSHTHVTGDTFEGVGHGGIYFANQNGSAYIQDAEINNVKYRGMFKTIYDYTNQYGVAAMYVGSVDGNGGISVYMDNCRIDGGGPSANGAEPIRFRESENELNNAVYMSNCTVTGDGNMRFGNSTHRLYNGFSNRIMTHCNISECVVQTNSVYHSVPELSETL